jgi:hypothetical protein
LPAAAPAAPPPAPIPEFFLRFRLPGLNIYTVQDTLSNPRIHVFLGLLDPDPDPLVRGMDPDPDPSIIKQK